MAKLLKLRRGTTSQHSSFTGAEGEVTVDTTKDTIVVHDGSTAGGTPLAKEATVSALPAVIDEDNMSSDSATRPPSQQSVKAFVDTSIAGNVIDEDNMASNNATKSPSQQSVKAYVDSVDATKAPLASPALTGNATAVNLSVSGNLTVNGSTTTVATTNTSITDNLIELNSGAGSNANDAGILIERGSTGDNAIIAWDESADKFTVGTTTGTASSTGNISITTGTLVANVEGNVTGNVTGNADTATGLATARDIGGVSFSGTASINLPGVNIAGNQNTTGTSGGFTAGSASNLNSGTVPTARLGSGTASNSNFLRGDGSWQVVDTSPAGSNTQVQFNNSGSFAGSSSLTFNSGTGALTATTVLDGLGDLRSVPRLNKTAAYTLIASDAGKCITTNNSVTVNPSVLAEADVVSIINTTGSNITITQGSNFTIYYTADGTSGNRTLNKRGMATLYFTDHNVAYIAGGGLS